MKRALMMLCLLAASCGGKDAATPGGKGAKQVSPASKAEFKALMARLDPVWQRILLARGDGDHAAVARFARELQPFIRNPVIREQREDRVWRNYVDLMDAGMEGLQEVESEEAMRTAVQELELSCNECHRRYR